MVSMTGIFGSLVRFLVTLVVSAVVLWLAQKIVLPEKKERSFLSALALAFVWSVIDFVLGIIFVLLPLWILEKILIIVIWIWVLKVWFRVGWLTAAAISVVAWIISAVIGFFLMILHLL
ncbi:MAG: hypothetical protein QI197_02545 [Candidatus Korarchaeota archaeon]|nr:hypothetical protein [Candidatus Korarchaeota archaeon]